MSYPQHLRYYPSATLMGRRVLPCLSLPDCVGPPSPTLNPYYPVYYPYYPVYYPYYPAYYPYYPVYYPVSCEHKCGGPRSPERAPAHRLGGACCLSPGAARLRPGLGQGSCLSPP